MMLDVKKMGPLFSPFCVVDVLKPSNGVQSPSVNSRCTKSIPLTMW